MRLLLALFFFSVLGVTQITPLNYDAPENCDWSFRDPVSKNEVSLTCNVRTISSDLDSSSLSISQTEHTKELKVQCSDVLFFQSSLQSRIFQRLFNLESLSIEYCKLTDLPSGTFLGLDVLKHLTVTTHNSDWSAMELQLQSESLVGMPKLESLQLGRNNLWNLPERVFCPLPALRHLNLTWNRLQDVSEVGVSGGCGAHLITLDLSGNDLVMLPEVGLAGLESLKKLFLQYNEISMMADNSLSGLHQLEILNISSNKLAALPPEIFNETLFLQELHIQNNSISVLAPGLFSNLAQLTILDLSSNHLTSEWVTSETFLGLVRLVVLNLSRNKLSQITPDMFMDLSALQVLDLSHNDLTTIADSMFSSLANLHRLDLSFNRLANMEGKSLAGLHVLSSLSLSHNNLTGISPNALQNCTSLRNLRFEYNFLHEIPEAVSQAKSLRTLRLSHNLLSEVKPSDLVQLKQLQHLDMSNNVLRNICKNCLEDLKEIEVLDLSMNEIKTIAHNSFDSNKGLKLLRLDGNKLNDVNALFATLPNLIWLNVSDNRITWFDYALIPAQLQYLDLQHNKIIELGNYYNIEKDLQLKTLDASHNLIEKLGPSSIPNSVKLLFVNSNRITHIAPGTFTDKHNISMVDLFDNLLSKIELNSLLLTPVPDDKDLPQFYIGGNPIFCDCNMEWMHRVHQINSRRQHPRVMDLDKVTCTLPYPRSNDNRISFLETRATQFLCPYSSHCFALCQCCDFIACDCQMTCPTGCSCYHDDTWATNIVDCSARGHQQLPDDIPMDATIVYMDANDMNFLDAHHLIGRKNLFKLFLNDSKIEAIQNRTFHGLSSLKELHLQDNNMGKLHGYEFEFLDHLNYLDLRRNRLKFVHNDSFSGLGSLEVLLLQGNFIVNYPVWNLKANKGLQTVGLDHNLWSCDCQFMVDFKNWLKRHLDIVQDSKSLTCVSEKSGDMGPNILETSYSCENFVATSIVQEKIEIGYIQPVLITVGIFFGVLVIAITLVLMRQRIHKGVAKKCGLKLFPQDPSGIAKDDKSIVYDAFISHSDLDTKFVNDTLTRELENSEPPYKLILSSRDYETVGNYVGDFIVHSIETSRKSVIVITKNFLDKDWCRFSFKAAHLEALKNYKTRIVVVMVGQITENDFDSDLSTLVKGAPCIHFEDSDFWNKLHSVLPTAPSKSPGPECFINETNYVTRSTVPGFQNTHALKNNPLLPTMVLNATNIQNGASLPHPHHHHHHGPHPHHHTMAHQRPIQFLHQQQTSIGSDGGEHDKTFVSVETAQSSLAPSLAPSVAPSLSHSYMSIDYGNAATSAASRTSHIYASIDDPLSSSGSHHYTPPSTSSCSSNNNSSSSSHYQPLPQPIHQPLQPNNHRRPYPINSNQTREVLSDQRHHHTHHPHIIHHNTNNRRNIPDSSIQFRPPDIAAVPASYFI